MILVPVYGHLLRASRSHDWTADSWKKCRLTYVFSHFKKFFYIIAWIWGTNGCLTFIVECIINCQRPWGSPLKSMGEIITSQCPIPKIELLSFHLINYLFPFFRSSATSWGRKHAVWVKIPFIVCHRALFLCFCTILWFSMYFVWGWGNVSFC